MQIPFSAYDFFGYLASGFLLLVTVDYAFDVGWVTRGDPGIIHSLFWITVAYITGQIVANVAGQVLEEWVVRGLMGAPDEILLLERKVRRAARFFPGFYRPLPSATQARVLARAKERAGIEIPSRSLFLHCQPIVKRDKTTMERLNSFLNQYGFCRNVSMALVCATVVLLVGTLFSWQASHPSYINKLAWAIAAALGSIGMFYRYLKFYRQYTYEVYITYAEAE